MTRLGAFILALIVLGLIAFGTMLSFGPSNTPKVLEKREAVRPPALEANKAGLTVPVAGVAADKLLNTWGEARGGGTRRHQAIDILAPANTPVVAAGPGRVEKLFNSRDGGLTLYVRSLDRRWSHYYAHLAGYAPGIREGMAVNRGTLLGYVGDTGNAGPGNTHLHFGMSQMTPSDRWHQGTPVNPYPLLAGKHKVR